MSRKTLRQRVRDKTSARHRSFVLDRHAKLARILNLDVAELRFFSAVRLFSLSQSYQQAFE